MELSPANIRSTPSVNLREMRALIQAGVFYRNAADTNWAAACQTQLTLPVALSRCPSASSNTSCCSLG